MRGSPTKCVHLRGSIRLHTLATLACAHSLRSHGQVRASYNLRYCINQRQWPYIMSLQTRPHHVLSVCNIILIYYIIQCLNSQQVTFVQIRYISDIEMAVYENAQHEWKWRLHAHCGKECANVEAATPRKTRVANAPPMEVQNHNVLALFLRKSHFGGQDLRESSKRPSRQHGKQQVSSVCRNFGSHRTRQTAPSDIWSSTLGTLSNYFQTNESTCHHCLQIKGTCWNIALFQLPKSMCWCISEL